MSYRSDAVRSALKEWREHPNGCPDLYWREVLPPDRLPFEGNWCGAFALRSLKKAGLAKDLSWIVSFGFIGPERLPIVEKPLPGDLLVIPEPFQHQALIVSYEPTTGMVTSIDGNVPGIAPKVRFKTSNMQFYSIQPLIDAAQAAESPWGYLLAGAALVGVGAYIWLNGVPRPVERQLRRLGL